MTESEILQLINDDKTSTVKQQAEIGERYYDGQHDILNYRIYAYDADGQLQEDVFKSNIRISHPFFTELVDQQVQYMLSGGEGYVRSDIPALQKELDSYFGGKFTAELNELLTSVVSQGFGYMYAITDKEGKTQFETAAGNGVVEVRARDTDDNCDYVIYWYVDRVTKGKEIKRIQVWDKERVTFYVADGEGTIEKDMEMPLNPRPHTIVQKDNKLLGRGFGFIPFWRLDNCRKRLSELHTVKGLIDDYDLMACSLSNNLQDFADALYVVKGYEGNLDEMMQNIKAKKHIGVDSEGSVDIQTINIPYDARKTKLELDEINIYRFGMGFNSTLVGDGNVTNIVLKSRYALLDLKCNKLEIRLKRFLRQLLDVVLDEINRFNGTAYTQSDVYIEFEREVMTNASDNAQIALTDAQRQQTEITTMLNLANVLDDETILQNVCSILDIDYEAVKNSLPNDGGLSYAMEMLEDEPETGGSSEGPYQA